MRGPEIDLPGALDAISRTRPLIDAVTNAVTVNGVANAILHWGGLPVMADDLREVAEMIATADGCLLNTGDVSETGEKTMLAAGRAANEHGVPIVLDPVGVGATPTRVTVTKHLLADLDVAIVNGNHAEIGAIAGEGDSASETSEIRGVEAVGESNVADVAATAIVCARETDAVVVVSGETDVVADGETAYAITAGHPTMGRVVGTGCMLGATLAVFVASLDDSFDAALTATTAYGLAGERAAAGDFGVYAGPASYEMAFRDAMAGIAAAPDGDGSTDASANANLDARIERVATTE